MIFTFGVIFVLIFDSSLIANKKQSKRNIVKTKVESIGYVSVASGFHCFKNNPSCVENFLIDPIHEYSREEGQSITGGYVYRGKEIPKLVGSYLYGDFVTGKIWALKQKNGKKISNELVVQVPFQISTFGQDISGEVYFADFGSGNIFHITKKN